MNKKSTKRALLASVLSLLLCVSMLIGTTFAWFTDSVTSNGNKIVSGTLDISLHKMEESGAWTDISNKTDPLFDYNLWEPGYTAVQLLKVQNDGTLALKWNAALTYTGNISILADVIDVYVTTEELTAYPTGRDVVLGWTKKGTLREFIDGFSVATKGELNATDNKVAYLGIALHMQESAGNIYQGLDLGGTFDIRIFATQNTVEEDSFDKNYDVNATYLNKDDSGAWLINNLDELYYFATQVNGGNTYAGETVKLTADIDLSGYNWIPIGTTEGELYFAGTFDGQGNTVSNMVAYNSLASGLFGVTDSAVIKKLNVVNATSSGNHCSGAVVGKAKFTTIENCSVEDATITLVPRVINENPLTYDDGNHAGGVAGYAYACDILNCSAKKVDVAAYRDAGGVVGTIEGYTNATYPDKYVTNINGCSADEINITIDQITYFYEVKAVNAGGVYGRQAGNAAAVFVGTNSESNVNIETKVPVANTEKLQAALDSASDGDTIYLAKGVNYGNVYIGRPTASNDTTMYCETHDYTTTDAEAFKAHLAETGYHTTPKYTTKLSNVTIIGAKGANISGVLSSSGHVVGPAHDYVCDLEKSSGSLYYSTLNIVNLTFKDVAFTGQVNINTSDAASVYDGITFDGCTFTTGGIAPANGAAIRYYNEANNGNVKNISVKNCIFNNCYQGIYVHHVNGVTVTGCTFDTTGHNAIAMQGHDGAVDLKNVVITGNTFKNIGDRVIRFNEVGADSNITIKNNTATNSGNTSGEVMKATSIASGITTSISGNTWNGVVANDELKDA